METKLRNYFGVAEFKQLLEQLKNKYIQYGSCIGTINVIPKTDMEAKKLSGFLACYIKVDVKTNIKIANIQKAIDDSIFEGITVDELVLMFFPNIKSKKQIKNETNLYVESELTRYKQIYGEGFLNYLLNNKEVLKKITYFIINDNLLLENIFKALYKLPINENNNEYLSIFASSITGNPHYFDLDTHNSNVFIQFVCYLIDVKYENNRGMKKKILEQVGILVDEVSNYVITYNLSGNEMLDSFKKNLTPLTLNLSNIDKLSSVKAENNTLLIVENPSFISKINNREIDYSVIITSGNSNLVIYKLLECIHAKMYFNGDFDPEGLLIAQNFKDRYPDIQLIGYNERYFYNGISDNKINTARLKKLSNISNDDLKVIKDLLILNGVSSYQELNYNLLLDEMKSLK